MSIYASVEALKGKPVFDVPEGIDKTIDSCIPILHNAIRKFYTIPDDIMYDIFIDAIMNFNKYAASGKKAMPMSYMKLCLEQQTANYMKAKKNQMRQEALMNNNPIGYDESAPVTAIELAEAQVDTHILLTEDAILEEAYHIESKISSDNRTEMVTELRKKKKEWKAENARLMV